MSETKRCAAEGCERPVPRKFLMCNDCWAIVPPFIRKRIFRFRRDPECRGYKASVNEAVEIVRRHQSRLKAERWAGVGR